MFLHRGNKIAEAKVICSTVPEIAGNRDICRIGGVRVYVSTASHIPPGREGLFNMIKGFPDDFCSRMGLWSPMAHGETTIQLAGSPMPLNRPWSST